MQYLTEPELKRLVMAIPSARNRLMVLVAFWHGLRATEVTSLKGEDLRDGHISVKRLKGSLPTIQAYQIHPDPILDESIGLHMLEPLLDDDQLAFPMSRFAFYRVMRQAGRKAGIPKFKKVRPHILKHSIAMQTIRGAGVENVRAWLGHKNLNSTGYYLKVTDEEAGKAISAAMLHKAGFTNQVLKELMDKV